MPGVGVQRIKLSVAHHDLCDDLEVVTATLEFSRVTTAAFGRATRPRSAAGPNGIDQITANSQILSHLQSMVI